MNTHIGELITGFIGGFFLVLIVGVIAGGLLLILNDSWKNILDWGWMLIKVALYLGLVAAIGNMVTKWK